MKLIETGTFSNLDELGDVIKELISRQKKADVVLWFAHELILSVYEETLSDGSICQTLTIGRNGE